MIDRCHQIIESDYENFKDLLYYIIQNTDKVNLVLVTKCESDFSIKDHVVSSFIKQI